MTYVLELKGILLAGSKMTCSYGMLSKRRHDKLYPINWTAFVQHIQSIFVAKKHDKHGR